MKILAIDTTGLVASVALVDECKTIGEFTTNYKKTHSQTIMPMVEMLGKMLELNFNDIDYVACASGPGSFTGLRIGAATCKGLAHGLGKKIIPVPTLDALAYNIVESNSLIVPIMDARRNQVYTAFYKSGEKFSRVSDYMAMDIETVLDKALAIDNNAIFLGDGVPVFMDTIKNRNEQFKFAMPNMNMQSAASVGALALNMQDMAVDCNEFELMYLRKSQAERERDEKLKGATND